MPSDVQLYFYDASTAPDYPPSEEQVGTFPAFYRTRFETAKAEHIRMQAAGSARLLEEHLGVTSDEQLVRGEHGAPSLKDGSQFFSISHSGPWTILAVCDSPVGVDIETEASKQKYQRIVHRFFPPDFRTLVEETPEDRKHAVFLECWTRLEAALKADRTGFTVPRETFPEVLEKYHLKTFRQDGLVISIATPKT